MQVNSLIIMAEEANMQLTPDTNFNALRDEKEPSKISIWISNCRKCYVEILRVIADIFWQYYNFKMLLNTISCPLSNSMKNFESIDVRHDFEELTDL